MPKSRNSYNIAKKNKNSKNDKNIFLIKIDKNYIRYILWTVLPKNETSNPKKLHFLHLRGAKIA